MNKTLAGFAREAANSAVRGSTQHSLERETGFEPATSTLARSHSTAELLPLAKLIIAKLQKPGN